MLKASVSVALYSTAFSTALAAASLKAAVDDTPFLQEAHEPYRLGDAAGINDVRAVALDASGNVWAATVIGTYTLDRKTRQWSAAMPASDAGPSFDVAPDNAGSVYVGAWNGLYRSTGPRLERIPQITHPISAVCVTDKQVVAFGPDGLWHLADQKVTQGPLPCARSVRAVLPDPRGGFWIATEPGLYHCTPSQTRRFHTDAGLISARILDLAWAPDQTLWVAGLGGITVFREDHAVRRFTPKEGLPSADVRCVRRAPDGTMWVGTTLGVARYDGRSWSLRHSKRWLLHDEVRDIAFDAEGTAWIATAGGVSAIRRVTTTLTAKADHYLRICLARHVREPGLVEKCRLDPPGDLRTFKPRDDDNDGQYTSMYLAMESFRYAATKAADARANARKAFDALHFLQTVTETPGFIARTVVPATWTQMADANRTLTDREQATDRVRDPRDKYVAVRWRPSRDGKWLWKGDTSSDEITGHFYGYLMYFDFAADDTERPRVAAHVRRVMDAIIDGGYTLKDLDGRHTRWAVWSPEKLNGDPDWQFERGINSVEILSYLKTTYRITGDEKYQQHYLDLLHKHHYADNVLKAKTTDPAWRTHIDEELLALAYPALLLHETDPALRALYRRSLDAWYAECHRDQSPFFDFLYASLTGEPPDPMPAVRFLRDAPLDLIRWCVDNSTREDLRIVRYPEMERPQTDRILPPSERGVIRWDDNPYLPVQGDDGETESDGVFWLLPYWMGRHYGYIAPAR